jgi:non-specific serine/threonine protein kinase
MSMAAVDTPHNNLPLSLTRFIGRERELAAVRAQLGAVRLLTLTGTGGCGKTRLALQVAATTVDDFPDGVWLVELAPLADPALVPQAVAVVLGVSEQSGQPLAATLSLALRPKQVLLLLDNCEHLLDACAELVEMLLTGCPGLVVLTTSREMLGVPGEMAWRVPSLTTPDPQRLPPLDEVLAYDAIQLFVERARLVQPAFAVTEQNGPALAEICRRLDGIPLAIELAAARVTALSVDQIAARLHDRFRLLTGGRRTGVRRQQTLEAAVAWSYDLLTAPERALLRRLAVLAGGWTLDAAEQVGTSDDIADWQVLNLLTRLVEKSLVVAEAAGGEARYRLLETIRQYAEEQLLASGEAAAARDRHLAWAVALGEQAEPVLWGNAGDRDEWLLRLHTEHDNLRAALEWSQERDPEAGLRLAVSLAEFWRGGRLQREGWQWLDTLLERSPGRTVLHGYALLGAGRLYREHGELAQAKERLAASAAIFEEHGDRRGLANALSRLGLIADGEGDAGRARELQEESLAHFQTLGDRQGQATALMHLGIVLMESGTLAEARSAFEECLPLFRALGETQRVAHVLHWLSGVARLQGDFPRARTLVTDALTVLEPTRFKDPYRSWRIMSSSVIWLLRRGSWPRRQPGIERRWPRRWRPPIGCRSSISSSSSACWRSAWGHRPVERAYWPPSRTNTTAG